METCCQEVDDSKSRPASPPGTGVARHGASSGRAEEKEEEEVEQQQQQQQQKHWDHREERQGEVGSVVGRRRRV